MSTSFASVLIMFFIDGYMHVYFTEYSTLEAFMTIAGRLFQYNAVLLLIYLYLYWPYRRNFLRKGARGVFDVSSFNHSFDEGPSKP